MTEKEVKKCYIPVGSKKVYVTKEIFDEFNRLRSRQAYYNNRYRDNTCELKEEGIMPKAESVEDVILKKCLMAQLDKALHELEQEELSVIHLIFFEDMSERKAAEVMKMKQYQVHRIKEKTLKKIKNKIIF